MGYRYASQAGILIYNTRINYVSVPILTSLKLPIGVGKESRAISVQVGFIGGRVIGVRDILFGSDIGLFIRPYDFQAALGATLSLNERLGISARFNHGLIHIFTTESNRIEANKNIQLSFRWNILTT